MKSCVAIGMVDCVRYVLTSALIYGSYRETGICTALALFLICLTIELRNGLQS